MREEFEPCSNMFPHADGEVLNNEVIIIHSPGSIGEPEVFEPYTEICLLSIFGDVGRRSEAPWDRHSLDALTKGPWSRSICAGTPIIWSATTPGVPLPGLLDGPIKAHVVCSHCRPMDVIIMPGPTSIADDAVSILVQPEAFAHRRSVWSGCWVRLWCSCALLCRAQ